MPRPGHCAHCLFYFFYTSIHIICNNYFNTYLYHFCLQFVTPQLIVSLVKTQARSILPITLSPVPAMVPIVCQVLNRWGWGVHEIYISNIVDLFFSPKESASGRAHTTHTMISPHLFAERESERIPSAPPDLVLCSECAQHYSRVVESEPARLWVLHIYNACNCPSWNQSDAQFWEPFQQL